jgi:hypothetical protein
LQSRTSDTSGFAILVKEKIHPNQPENSSHFSCLSSEDPSTPLLVIVNSRKNLQITCYLSVPRLAAGFYFVLSNFGGFWRVSKTSAIFMNSFSASTE